MEKFDCTKKRQHNDSRDKIGVLFLIIGLILLGKNLNFIPSHMVHYIFSWQMLLIAIGLVLVLISRRNIGGFFLIGIGGLFLWDKLLPLSDIQWKIAWPGLFIFVGLSLVIGYLSKPGDEKKQIRPKNTKPKSKLISKSNHDDVEFDIDKIEPIEE
jgi:predicted membrane protein